MDIETISPWMQSRRTPLPRNKSPLLFFERDARKLEEGENSLKETWNTIDTNYKISGARTRREQEEEEEESRT